MFQKIGLFTACVVAALSILSIPVSAIQSPAGCNSNRLNLSLTRDKIEIKEGDTLTYTIMLSNLDSGSNLACDIDTATVALTLPALDGTPTGQVVTLTTTGNYPAGTPVTVVGTVPYTVNVNDGVVDASAEATVNGVLHDAPTDHAAQINKTIGTTIIADDTVPPEDISLPPSTPSSSTITLPGMPNTSTAL